MKLVAFFKAPFDKTLRTEMQIIPSNNYPPQDLIIALKNIASN
jgi:hypothetical protein